MAAKKKKQRHPLLRYLFDHDLTQEAFAERIGVSKGHLSRLLAGQRKWTADTIKAVVRATDGAVTYEVLHG